MDTNDTDSGATDLRAGQFRSVLAAIPPGVVTMVLLVLGVIVALQLL